MDFNLQPFLENDSVLLRPLREEDFDNLYEVASDPLIWEQHQNKDRFTHKIFTEFFEEAIVSKGAFAIVDKRTDKIIGSSRFKIIDSSAKIIEIGWSFLARNYWGGLYNHGVKKLMINYALKAFDKVVFYVHAENYRSQRALEKLGALKIIDFGKSWVLPKERGVTFVIDRQLK